MRSTYPLYCGDDEVGSVTVQRDGLRLYLQAECRIIDGVHRAWLVSGDDRLLIGVLMPDGQRMYAKKTYNLSAIGSFDSDAITHGDIGISAKPRGWQRCRDPKSLFTDEIAKNSPNPNFEYWVKPDENGKVIAVPWKGGKFPLPALFCLCSVECINGRQMVVIAVDEHGMPAQANFSDSPSQDFG